MIEGGTDKQRKCERNKEKEKNEKEKEKDEKEKKNQAAYEKKSGI